MCAYGSVGSGPEDNTRGSEDLKTVQHLVAKEPEDPRDLGGKFELHETNDGRAAAKCMGFMAILRVICLGVLKSLTLMPARLAAALFGHISDSIPLLVISP